MSAPAKYRKRPIVIEAFQTDVALDIETLEGVMHASPGDWIITGVKGEQYPCKPDIFAATYEDAAEPPKPPAPEPVAWMVVRAVAVDCAHTELYLNKSAAQTAADRRGGWLVPLVPDPGPMTEEWAYRTDWGFCVTASKGMAERMAAAGPASVVRRLVGPWEEVK